MRFSDEGEAITSKTGGGLHIIGVDYGRKASIGVVMQRNADGSWVVLEEISGRGLDDLATIQHEHEQNTAATESGLPAGDESGGR
ncbi:MAG TPA: hypothetical protein VGN74_05370 [Brevundimonas sp.]|jgi:hypothetical protein|uniref:hypothetical protein n=1 Tax=Brevundimonas sp. TaxID=1871086 RepID=UPI002E12770E|nr:hypothetical protein [Brevundimonas sp.]